MIIEFVEVPLPSRRAWALSAAVWVVVAVLVGMVLVLDVRLDSAMRRRHEVEMSVQRPAAPSSAPSPPPYQEQAVDALRRAALPEGDALAELEQVAVVGIQIRSIVVSAATSLVTVDLEARDDTVLADYLDQLNAGLPSPKWHIKVVSEGTSSVSSLRGAQDVHSAEPTRLATLTRQI